MLYTYYQQTPLPRPLAPNDEMLPLFVVTSLPHGVAGFIVAAIVAAALSPSINALAATTVNDFYVKYVRPDADEATLMRVSRRATIGWGVAQIAVALGAQWIDRSVLDAGLLVLSFAAGPVLGAFLVGVLSPRGSTARDAGRHDRRGRRRCAGCGGPARAPGRGTRSSARASRSGVALCASLALARPGRCLSAFGAAPRVLDDGDRAPRVPGGTSKSARAGGPLWRACVRRADLRADAPADDATTRSSISRR